MKRTTLYLHEKLLIVVLVLWLLSAIPAFFLTGASVAAISLIIASASGIFCCVVFILQRRHRNKTLRYVSTRLSPADRASLERFPLPAVVVDEAMELQWGNRAAEEMLRREDGTVPYISEAVRGLSLRWQGETTRQNVSVNGCGYTVYGNSFTLDGQKLFALYFHDDDELKGISREYFRSRPVVMILVIDNFDEMIKEARDLERAQFVAAVEEALLHWTKSSTGILNRYEREKYFFVFEQRDLDHFIKTKFEILETVRKMTRPDGTAPTLSIGVGQGYQTLAEGETAAKQALDMALGRGGDQVVIKNADGYQFFGGKSKGIERSSRVKSRMVASTFENLIRQSGNVLIMGHRLSDLDCIGAAAGMQFAAYSLGRDAKCVVNREATMAGALIDSLCDAGLDFFVSPAQARRLITDKTLLIIVDTHRTEIMEAPELCQEVKTVAVIDHHRRTADSIQDTTLFYHEPNASSACEMVTELLQYMNCGKPNKAQSEALLAGIMLDTKNFSQQTGVRTFEAAAYLRRRGADTLQVRRLFSSTFEDCRVKAQLMAGTTLYRSAALAVWRDKFEESLRIVAPQTADELLNVRGVDASFALYAAPEFISVSARSQGKLNVQLVMERLGGGGHHMMAGAQLRDIDIDEAVRRLKEAIDAVQEQLGMQAGA